jgi:paraquat-inducible protein B
MAVEKRYARLGFFILVAVVVVLGTAIFFIQRLRSRASIAMVTYVSENVSGLDVSSPVRYRGVPVGRVTDLRVDPRMTTIEIDFEVFVDRLNTIGLDVKRIRTITDIEGVFPKLRAQIVNNPISGEGYLLLDAPQNPPPKLELGFKPNRTYVASMPSVSARVQDKLPALLDRFDATLDTLTDIVGRMPASLDRSDRFFTNVEHIVRQSQLPALSADSRRFFATTTTQIEQMRSELDGVIGTEGALVKFSEDARAAIKAADLPAASRSAREAADNSRLVEDDLRRSLPVIRDSLEQVRELTRQLAEQPESVVYGPRPAAEKRK